jgi:transcriptional regulator with XRE-family HTH domain
VLSMRGVQQTVQWNVLIEKWLLLLSPCPVARQREEHLSEYLCSVDRPAGESSADMNAIVKVPPRQILSAERLRRHWSQLEVADQLGTTPGNVSRWERGITSPGPYFRSKLCELFGKSAQELGLNWEESDDSYAHSTHTSAPVAASSLWNTPPQSVPLFPGREDLLAHVRTLLGADPKTFPSILTSSDPGGLDLPEQEHTDHEGLVQAITQWLQTRPNWVLIVENAGAVALVVPRCGYERIRLFRLHLT